MAENKKIFNKKNILIGVAVVAAALILFGLLRMNAKSNEVKKEYTFLTLREKDPILLKGNSTAKKTQSIAVDASKGKVSEVLVKNGQDVKAGDKLFTYKSDVLDTQKSEAQSQYNRADEAYNNSVSDLEDAKSRQDENIRGYYTAKANLDDAENSGNVMDIQTYTADVQKFEGKKEASLSEVKQLERAVSQAESNKEDAYTRLENAKKSAVNDEKADFDGIVIIHEENEKGSMGSPFMEVITKDTIISSSVTEYDYNKLSVGKKVKLNIVPLKKQMEGEITELSLLPENSGTGGQSQMMGSAGVNYKFKVTTPEPVPYGYSAEIAIGTGEIVIPASAVINENSKTYLWTVQGETAHKKEVTLRDSGTYLTLQAGLKLGDVIIDNPDSGLTEGKAVKVTK